MYEEHSSTREGDAVAVRCVVIDDEALACTATVDMLKALGHEAVWAPDAVKGVKLVESGSYDVVITDIIMPGKQGYDAILELKLKQPTTKIIAMSGGGGSEKEPILEVATKLGADAVLAKPFGVEELRAALREALGDHPDR